MKNPTKDLPAEAELKPPSALDRINEFGEKNAKVIIIVSTILVIVTVLIIAESMFRKSQISRAERERAAAHTSAELLELKEKYKDVPQILPLIVLDLANTYYAENKLEDARRTYEEFVDKFAGEKHPLLDSAMRAKNECIKNLEFIEKQKNALMSVPTLDIHPLRKAKMAEETQGLRDRLKALKDKTDDESKAEAARLQAELDRRAASPLGIQPRKEPHPVLILKTKVASIRIELFEDEAPNAVAQIVALAKADYFKGLKFEVTDDQIRLLPKDATPVTDTLAFEPSSRDGDVGSVVLIRVSEGGDNKGAEFVILKKDRPLAGETVVGILQEGSQPLVRALKADDVIESTVLENLRDHEYKPTLHPKK